MKLSDVRRMMNVCGKHGLASKLESMANRFEMATNDKLILKAASMFILLSEDSEEAEGSALAVKEKP